METHLSFQFPFPGTQKITHYSQEDAEALVSIFKIKSSKKVTQAPKNIWIYESLPNSGDSVSPTKTSDSLLTARWKNQK